MDAYVFMAGSDMGRVTVGVFGGEPEDGMEIARKVFGKVEWYRTWETKDAEYFVRMLKIFLEYHEHKSMRQMHGTSRRFWLLGPKELHYALAYMNANELEGRVKMVEKPMKVRKTPSDFRSYQQSARL